MSTEDNSTTNTNTTAASHEKGLRSKSRLFWFCQFAAGLCFITAVILLAVGTSNIVSLQIDKSANVSHTAGVILKRREITAMACLVMGGVCVLASLGIICYTCLHIRRKINTVVKVGSVFIVRPLQLLCSVSY